MAIGAGQRWVFISVKGLSCDKRQEIISADQILGQQSKNEQLLMRNHFVESRPGREHCLMDRIGQEGRRVKE